jgi:hypothetical protein
LLRNVPIAASQSEVNLAPEDTESLHRLFESELRFRRVFIAGKFAIRERERCCLLVTHPQGGSFSVEAEAVFLRTEDPGAGIGLDLVGLDADKLAGLEAFVRRVAEAPAAASDVAASDLAASDEPATPNIYARIRQLHLPERQKVARQGRLSERVALERTFGGSVWEALLQNSSLTVPEVASIAKKGTLSQPLVAVIVANGGWLASGGSSAGATWQSARERRATRPRVAGRAEDRAETDRANVALPFAGAHGRQEDAW